MLYEIMVILRKTEFHGESNVWNTTQRQERVKDFMQILVLNEAMNHLVMVNSMY